jgi:RND family efflux transporter MFP subunit
LPTILSRATVILALAGLACGRQEPAKAPAAPPAPVRLVQEASVSQPGWVPVTLTATRRATLATRLAASVQQVLVTEGQQVAAGALLVSLSDEDLQSGRKAAETAVAAAAAQLHRMEKLASQDAATQAELDLAQVQFAQAKAALAGVLANIGYTQIRAPFAGVVQARRVNDGDFVGPGMPLVDLEGQGAMEFTGSVSEGEAQGLKIGQSLPFEADGRTGMARIIGLATGGDPVSHRSTLRARVAGGLEGLRSGAFGRLQVPGAGGSGNQALSIPRSALVRRGELNGVFLARDGQAQLRWLSLGEAQGDRFPVRAGLAASDPVIDAPGELRDGQPIEVRK